MQNWSLPAVLVKLTKSFETHVTSRKHSESWLYYHSHPDLAFAIFSMVIQLLFHIISGSSFHISPGARKAAY